VSPTVFPLQHPHDLQVLAGTTVHGHLDERQRAHADVLEVVRVLRPGFLLLNRFLLLLVVPEHQIVAREILNVILQFPGGASGLHGGSRAA
jgi:hypothetical protein